MGRREFFLAVAALVTARPLVPIDEFVFDCKGPWCAFASIGHRVRLVECWRGRIVLRGPCQHVWSCNDGEALRVMNPEMRRLRVEIMARPLVAVSPREVMARIRQWQ